MITLPPLPEPDFALDQGDEPCYYAHTVRAIQIAAARAALEAAAEAGRHRCATSGVGAATTRRIVEDIRALEIAP